jgi:peptide/nickel transport system ATP-binding protein
VTSILTLARIRHRFAVRGRGAKAGSAVWAVDGLDLEVQPGETVGIVGESGSGKSTIGLIATGLLSPTDGDVLLDGRPLRASPRPGRIQMVFQDPVSSLNPRMRVDAILDEPMRAQGALSREDRRQRTGELLTRVGLTAQHLKRRRAQLSGGQCQRVAIARAMTTRPDVIVLDEPTSSLDVIVQAKVLNLLVDFQEQYGIAYLFISHNLRVVEAIAHRVVVLYRGQVVEDGPVSAVLAAPAHPYTKALEAAVPDLETDPDEVSALVVDQSGATDRPSTGCPYAPRCPLAVAVCWQIRPPLQAWTDGRRVACHVANATATAAHDDRSALSVRDAPPAHPSPTAAMNGRRGPAAADVGAAVWLDADGE